MKRTLRLASTTLVLAVSSLSAATHYVSLDSTNPTPPCTNSVTAVTNIIGQAGTTAYADTNAPSLAPVFYRVGVGN